MVLLPMSMKKPELQDYRITPEQYAIYKESDFTVLGIHVLPIISIGLVAAVAVVTLAVTRDLGNAVGFGIIAVFPAGFLALAVNALGKHFKKSILLEESVVSQIELYEKREADYQAAQVEAEKAQREAERARWVAKMARRRQIAEHWMSLSGREFERELGALFLQAGFYVEYTPSSGDQGVDLILQKNGKTTVVQCKSHRNPVGPAVARELYGSFHHFSADSAILACTGGFTQGVKEFVRGKPITLVSADDLASWGASVVKEQSQTTTLPTSESSPPMEETAAQSGTLNHPAPTCPTRGCRKKMVLREGYRGKFWGCPRFPKCRGTRDI